MKLLDVEVVLNVGDKGIQQARHKSEVMKELDDTTTSYAILSHHWGPGPEEVNYEEMVGLMKMEEGEREEVKQRHGYQKIVKSCEQTVKDGYKWLWIDTCCIDKRSSAELNDVSESTFPRRKDDNKFNESNGWPEWFVRGWTLQELIAPKEVKFFNKGWAPIGNKRRLATTLQVITGIPREVLTSGMVGKRLSVAQIMSWAAERKTTRVEDRAYSLIGLFGVNMPMLYGEGRKAFRRLQLEIIRESSDHSTFAWRPQTPRTGSVLAEDPSDFQDCGDIEKVGPDRYLDRLKKDRFYYEEPGEAALRGAVDSHQFRTFTVSSAGIEVFLPVFPFSGSPSHFRAILPCSRLPGSHLWDSLITIDVASFEGSFARTSVDSELAAALPMMKTLHLIHHQDSNETRREFALDDRHASYHGFTRRGTYPREFTGSTVTLSCLADELIVVVYANNDARSCFAVGFGCCLGQGWVHIVCDERSPTQGEDWATFSRTAYDRMWKARAVHAESMPNRQGLYSDEHDDRFVKHAHLPRSIWAVRVVWGRWKSDNFEVMVDVKQCCDGPCRWMVPFNDRTGLAMPGLMDTVSGSYLLELDGWPATVNECFGQWIALGDYGDYSGGSFICTGNIFEDIQAAGIDLDDSHCPAVTSVSSSDLGKQMDWVKDQDDLAVAYSFTSETYLALHQPKAFSLSVDERISLLLNYLSTRLAGKHLVTTIIRCSDFYMVDEDGKRRDSDSAPDSGNHSAETKILTPLCVIARPHFWSKEPLHKPRTELFKSIRKKFYALMDMHHPTGTKPSRNSANGQEKDIAIKFFSDLFGLKYLKNYIGDITFLTRFPSMLQTSSVSDVLSVGVSEEDGLRAPPPSRKFAAAESDPRLEIVLPLLHMRFSALRTGDASGYSYDRTRETVENEIKSTSQTLGAALPKHILITFHNVYLEHKLSCKATYLVSSMKYDRQPSAPSMIQKIKALQVKLNATKDRREQRALEDDVTGKILWLFWCGICAEVDELLPKVVDYIRREGNKMGLRSMYDIVRSTERRDPGHDQVYFQRVMFDAETGTSKHHLWLAAHTAKQAKPSDTASHTSAIDTSRVPLGYTSNIAESMLFVQINSTQG